MSYDHKSIAGKIDQKLRNSDEFKVDTSLKGQKTFYSLGMFPYPSGNAHMGHVRVYTLSDIMARFKKLQGHAVLHPIGWDSFGLPAENAAIKNKVRPDLWTEENIRKMKTQQLNQCGWSFDWDKELNTSSPDYFKWTQWLFLELYKSGKAYRKADYVNWCPVDQTVLANEQVIGGKCWRDDAVVEKRLMDQWFFRITDYAGKLWDDISKLKNWASEAVSVQKNWINQKTGTYIDFEISELDENVKVFTTRPDTLFGVTAMVIAPEHPLAKKILEKHPDEKVADYIEKALKKSVVDRMQNKEKTGIKTPIKCKHPFADDCLHPEIDIWIGDYVIADFGTGAVMCVPAHDTRDFEFAKKFGLKIIEVVRPQDSAQGELTEAFTESGALLNSGPFDGESNKKAIDSITDKLQEMNKGQKAITYALKDWSVGRQRFWGCPIPIVHCNDCGVVPVPEDQLPVKLPELTDKDMDKGMLNLKHFPSFCETTCPKCKGPAKRETDTLDTFLCSSWYALRFCDNRNDGEIFDSQKTNRFMPIDFYVGGLEHAAQHMIYFRFITKFLNEQGYIDFDEPVDQFFCNGMVRKDGHKMSKSKGNVVIPNQAIEQFGADAVRLYVLSDTPSEQDIDWEDTGLQAKHDFIKKTYNSFEEFFDLHKSVSPAVSLKEYPNQDFLYAFYPALKYYQVTLESNHFHTAVAQIHIISNLLRDEMRKSSDYAPEALATLKKIANDTLVAFGVITPYFCQELLEKSQGKEISLYHSTWPEVLESYQQKNTVKLVVQVNGKKRALLEIERGLEQEAASKIVFDSEDVKRSLDGKNVFKEIYIKDKIYNIVAK